MSIIEYLEHVVSPLLPELWVLGALAGCLLMLLLVSVLAYWLLFVRRLGPKRKLTRQAVILVLASIGMIAALLILGGYTGTAQTVVGLLGLIVSVALAISSTTFTSNAMAGLMLRAVRNFRMGDFVRVGEYFGRVAERGLLHIEIQTEDRDLATLPNMYLVSNPVTVVRASGTIISTTLSLGYDVPHTEVKTLLEKAATMAELKEPFVYILKLGDFSITYRIAGFLPEVKHLLSARSLLQACVLDSLHAAGIEIVSPTFMNQRRITEAPVVSLANHDSVPSPSAPKEEPAPEDIMFDKAEEAERVELDRFQLATLEKEINELESGLKEADDTNLSSLEAEIQKRRAQIDLLKQDLDAASVDDVD